jgi:hypothetical protein
MGEELLRHLLVLWLTAAIPDHQCDGVDDGLIDGFTAEAAHHGMDLGSHPPCISSQREVRLWLLDPVIGVTLPSLDRRMLGASTGGGGVPAHVREWHVNQCSARAYLPSSTMCETHPCGISFLGEGPRQA